MGVKRLREDSVKELSKQKTRRQLQEENEQLRAKVESLEGQDGRCGQWLRFMPTLSARG